jgi:predicted nucleic acid-binding protein
VILVDTSVWIDHLRAGNRLLVELLEAGNVLVHPFVIGEIALGNLKQRELILGALADLPQAVVARDDEVMPFIEGSGLFGRGIGYLDVHLLASIRLTAGSLLWTHDRRLRDIAEQLGMAVPPGGS